MSSRKIDTKSLFFLFLYFSRMNWIHKFQMRVFEGGQCWHECQGDWRINIVNLKEIQPPCPARCLPSIFCSILFCLFNWAVAVQQRHKMMINFLSASSKLKELFPDFPPAILSFVSVLKFHMRIAENEICAPTLFDHRLTIAWPLCVAKPIKPGLLSDLCHARPSRLFWNPTKSKQSYFAVLVFDLCHVATRDLRLKVVISIVRDPNSSSVIFPWSKESDPWVGL